MRFKSGVLISAACSEERKREENASALCGEFLAGLENTNLPKIGCDHAFLGKMQRKYGTNSH